MDSTCSFVGRTSFDIKKRVALTKAKVQVGNWEFVRAFIECWYGYHNYLYYSLAKGFGKDLVHNRAHPVCVSGYRLDEYIYRNADLEKCHPFRPSDPIPPGMWILVVPHTIPPWGWKYLPQGFYKQKMAAKRESGRKPLSEEPYHPGVHYADVPQEDKIALRAKWLKSKVGKNWVYAVPEPGK